MRTLHFLSTVTLFARCLRRNCSGLHPLRPLVISVLKKRTEMTKDRTDHTPLLRYRLATIHRTSLRTPR